MAAVFISEQPVHLLSIPANLSATCQTDFTMLNFKVQDGALIFFKKAKKYDLFRRDCSDSKRGSNDA